MRQKEKGLFKKENHILPRTILYYFSAFRYDNNNITGRV